MKTINEQRFKLWGQAEKALADKTDPENLRTSGLLAAERNHWIAALIRLDEALRHGVRDLQTLDTFGEAAYQTKTYEALLPFETLYTDPMIASHMARAQLMLGQYEKARHFLHFAQSSLLKSALVALLGVEKDIETSARALFTPLFKAAPTDLKAIADNINEAKKLSFVEYWQALAPVAEAVGRQDLMSLAEQRLKALAYDRPVVHFNQSLRFLAEGEFRAGWKLYDWRLSPGSPCASVTSLAQIPMWEGEFLESKKLLVVLENGFGDQIFGLRFAKALLQTDTEIEIAAGPEMSALVQSSFPHVKIHDVQQVRSDSYWVSHSAPDYWTYCFSIPARADLCEPILTEGYLEASSSLVDHYKRQINPGNRTVHGLVWHGDIRTAPMRTRAYSVQEFLNESEILKNPCVLVCLQKDATPEEIAELKKATEKSGSQLIVASTTLENFAHTAAWLRCLDKMWSCDTATAHLAGALGVSTNVLIRNKSIWHWRCDSDHKSVWYQSVRIKYALVPAYSYMFEIRET